MLITDTVNIVYKGECISHDTKFGYNMSCHYITIHIHVKMAFKT